MGFDLSLQHALNALAGSSPVLDRLAVFIAQDSPFVLALLLLAVYFAPHAARRVRRRLAIYAALAGLVAVGVNVLIGLAWYRPRPFVALGPAVHLLIHHGRDASFPSDHAALAFAVAAALAPIGPAWAWSLYIFGALVAIARVFVGVHWPTDVIAAAVLGILVARGLWTLAPRLDPGIDKLLAALGPLGRDADASPPADRHLNSPLTRGGNSGQKARGAPAARSGRSNSAIERNASRPGRGARSAPAPAPAPARRTTPPTASGTASSSGTAVASGAPATPAAPSSAIGAKKHRNQRKRKAHGHHRNGNAGH